MTHHYFKNQLIRFWLLLLCLWWSSVFSQTPKPNFVLNETETGTKDYQARDYVRLTPGFSYAPATGQNFKARINTTLSFNTLNIKNPNPGEITGGDTSGEYVPGGSFGTDPVAHITGPVIKIQKAGSIPGTFVTQDVFTYPVMWFKTVPTANNLNGEYHWLDVCDVEKPAKLKRYSAQGEGTEFTLTREKMRAYNFYPSMDISYETVNKVIAQNKTNLAQSTIIGAWGATDNFYTENFMFALKGRIKDTLLVSNSRIAHLSPDMGNFKYDTTTVDGFLFHGSQSTDSVRFRERALRVGSFYRATQPNNTLWGEPAKADIVLGGQFNATVVNPTSKFTNDWTSLPAFKGSVPELLVFDRQLSETETGIFESYLALKYGITMNKDYRSSNGSIIWNKNENVGFNNRVIGYGREDALGFDQKMSTTSHEEKPYYTDLLANDAYDSINSYKLSSRNRLLVAGLQPGNTLNDGKYIVIGDNSDAITTENTTNGYVGTMKRDWLVKTNDTLNTSTFNWEINNLIKTDVPTQKASFIKYSSGNTAWAKTSTKLMGRDGYLAWTVEQEYGPITVGFGTSSRIASNQVDMGYYITPEGYVKLIKNGIMVNDSFAVQKGQRIEVEKRRNVLFMRINGVRYRNTEYDLTATNQNAEYYGGIFIYPSMYDIKISNVRHGGFVDTGHKLELSYAKATEFAPYRKGKTYLLITRGSQLNEIVSDEVDESRMKIIFNNIYWQDGDEFTFAYKGTPQQGSKKKDETIEPDYEFKNDIRVYHKDPADRSNITVRVETARLSTAVVTVYDMSGRRMDCITLPEGCEARYADLHIEMRGIYIVKVITNDKEYSKKVIVN